MRSRLIIFALLAASGCAGGRANLKFDDTRYPVSLSATVVGSDGNVLLPARREKVGDLHIETKAWGILWAAVPLTPNKDLSTRVNEQIAAAGGHAVVNLRITSRQCGMNHAWVVSTVPLWPGCSKVFVQGDIIRELPATPVAIADGAADASAPGAHPLPAYLGRTIGSTP